MLILSAALGLWTLSSALAIGGVLGSLFFAAAFLGLAFDVLDLFRLTSGELSPEDYLVEMAVGLLLEAALGGLGDVVRRLGVGQLADEVIQRVIRQMDELTGGLASRWTKVVCPADVQSQPCAFLSEVEYAEFNLRVPNIETQQLLDSLLESNFLTNKQARAIALNTGWTPEQVKATLSAIENAPGAPNKDGFRSTINSFVNQENPGNAYELVRARNNVDAGEILKRYGGEYPVKFPKVVRIENGQPVFGEEVISKLVPDSTYEGNIATDAKDGNFKAADKRVWDQIMKARAAIEDPNIAIDSFRFEVSGSIPGNIKNWVNDPANWKDGVPKITLLENLGDSVTNP